MPWYDFICENGHVTESKATMSTEYISCSCGLLASRSAVNHIGVSGFAEVPRDQKSYRESFKEYTEANAEVSYTYGRTEQPAPDLYGIAKQKFKER